MLRCRNDSDMLAQLDNVVFVDAPKIISYEKARMEMGNGYEFKHKNKQIHDLWEEFVEQTNLFPFMFKVREFESEMGACIVTINKSKAGNILLDVANPYFANGVACAYGSHDFAVLVEQVIVDNQLCLMRSAYDTEKIVRTLWSGQESIKKGQMNLYEYVAKLPKEKQLDYGEWDQEHNAYVKYHGMGVCPIQFFYNRPFKKFGVSLGDNYYYVSPYTTTANFNNTGWDYHAVSDVAKCSGLLLQLQNLYTQANKLGILDKPHVVINGLNQAKANQLRQDKQALSAFMKEYIINTGNAGSGGVDIKTVAPTNSLDNIYCSITNTWKDIYRCAGISYSTDSSVQKTAQESNASYDQSIQEVNFSRVFQTRQWISLFKKVFKAMGKELGNPNDWSFQFKRNIVIDEASRLDNLIKQVEMGIKTPVQAIAILEGMDEDNAKNLWEENKKWFEENDFTIAMKDSGTVSGVKGASLPGSKEKGGRPANEGKESN